MEVRQLNTLIRAAQFQSFSKAAESLGYSQSAVTVQIKALEDYIVAHGLDAVDVDEEGKAANEDLRTQCTITIQNYLQTVEKAVSQAEHPEPVQK